jgi:hypothetical protein
MVGKDGWKRWLEKMVGKDGWKRWLERMEKLIQIQDWYPLI